MGKQLRKQVTLAPEKRTYLLPWGDFDHAAPPDYDHVDRVLSVEPRYRPAEKDTAAHYGVIAQYASGVRECLITDASPVSAEILAREWADWYRENGLMRDGG